MDSTDFGCRSPIACRTLSACAARSSVADRARTGDSFGPPRKIIEIADVELNDGDPWLSPDRQRLYFSRSEATARQAEWAIYLSELEEY